MKRILLSLALTLGIFAIPIQSFATVQSTIDKKIYQGDNISTVFSFPYNIYLATDLAVYETITATSNTTQLTLNTNYTVTLTAISGVTGAYTATINLAGGSSPAGALAVGTQLTILRSLPLTQLINISDYSATPAATWNQALDRATILTQQMQEQINRAILAPVNSTAGAGYTLPNPVANEYIGWDPTGTFLINIAAGQPIGPTASPTFAGITLTGLNGILKSAGSSGVGIATADVDYSVPNGTETLTNKTFDTAGAGNHLKINGTAITGTVGSGSVLLGASAPLTGYTVQGSTTVLPTVSGVPTAGNCAKFDASHNLVDNGSTCSGGTGMVYPASAGIPITDTSSWKPSLAEVDGDIIYGTGGNWTVQAAPTWNQSTTGSAAKWTTARNLAGNSVDGSANVSFSNAFIVQGTADTGLTGAQFLGALGTGLVKNTNSTGVLSIASAGTDYAPATSGSAILYGNSGGFSNVTIGTGLSFTGGTLSNTATSSFVPNNIQVFVTSGTWTKPAGVSSVYVKVWGSGGAGGNGNAGGTGNTSSFAGSTTIQATGGTNGAGTGGGSPGAGGTGSGGTINLTGGAGGGVSGKTYGGGGYPLMGIGSPDFSANGTLAGTPASGYSYGGGGGSTSGSLGGGAGGYSEGIIAVTGNVTVTVGAGGTGGSGVGYNGGGGLVIVYY